MLAVDIIDRKRKVVGKVEVRDELLTGPINRLLLSDALRAQLANFRQGTASTKTRADIDYTNRKIYKQKGTGGARHGSRKAPIFVGGGTVFGPHPRSYRIDLPQKMRQFAFLSALRLKWKEQKLVVVNDLSFKAPKTKEAAHYFKDLSVKAAAVVLPEQNEVISKSIRNLPHFKTISAQGIRLLDLVSFDYLICTPDALKKIEARLFREG